MAANSAMEILSQNYLQTTTQFAVNNNTATVENILRPELTLQYYTDGMNDDTTTTTMRISFDQTVAVNRIALMEMNFKKFNLYYNGVTANTFALSGGATTTSQFITNSETSMYLRCSQIYCTSVSLDVYSTQVANSEKAIGHMIVSNTELSFSRMPSANNYTPRVDPEQVVHTMSDGGVRIHTVKTKHSADIKLRNISTAFRNSLRDIYDARSPIVFCPFGTTTGWDGICFEAVWPGNFDFYKFSDDAVSSGFSGVVSLKETSS